ncbi:MAG: hypothetical protein KAT05_06460, partial [Spirochaetes bacterium]|nr:hypothetical protein [Spirochaetota bacterium]
MKNSKKRSVNFFIFIIFTVLLFISVCCEPPDDNNDDNDDDVREAIANFAPSSSDTWTFMIYLDADNNLEEDAI